jgi:hypothetical protein
MALDYSGEQVEIDTAVPLVHRFGPPERRLDPLASGGFEIGAITVAANGNFGPGTGSGPVRSCTSRRLAPDRARALSVPVEMTAPFRLDPAARAGRPRERQNRT